MADGIKVQAGVGDATVAPQVATDDIGGTHYQKVKAGWGADGTWNETDDAGGKRLPVTVGMSGLTMAHTSATPGTSSGQVLASNSNRKYAFLQNIGSVDVDIKIGAAATANQGIRLYANGGFFEMSPGAGNLCVNAINGIVAAGTGTVLVTEGV